MKKPTNPSYITAFVFLAAIIIFGALSIANSSTSLVSSWETYSGKHYSKDFFNTAEKIYKTKFPARTDWINLYGITQGALHNNIIGNLEFVRDDDGIMNQIRIENTDSTGLSKRILQIVDVAHLNNSAALYVQMPKRTEVGVPLALRKLDEDYEDLEQIMRAENVPCLTETDIANASGMPFLWSDFYFKTDIHPTSEAEMWMASLLSQRLSESFGITVQNSQRYATLEGFEVVYHPFLGNFANSVGIYYAGVDSFNDYLPQEETSFSLTDATTGETVSGSFQDAVMQNMKESSTKDSFNPYWITNYLRYGSPSYTIQNNTIEQGAKLLFVCDSLCYRTISYLSLGCETITVIDPRFFRSETDYLGQAFDGFQYDAVIVLHGTSMFEGWE